MHRSKKRKTIRNKNIIIIAIFSTILLFLTAITPFVFTYYRNRISSIQSMDYQNSKSYSKHYALILEDLDSAFSNSIYEGAKLRGELFNVYVEKLGEDLPFSYDVYERFKMAIYEDVDGIIVEGSGDRDLSELIDRAVDSGIPVVTIIKDSPNSKRISFIGAGRYQLGKTYGQQILSLTNEKTLNVVVLSDTDDNSANPDIMLAGLKDTLVDANVDIQFASIDRKNSFASEETIHNIIMNSDNFPDVIVCLDAIDTISAYQTLVDNNQVGKIQIIGYYNSAIIQSAIEKEIIHSTIVVDTKQIGRYCIDALNEYAKYNRVSDYIAVDIDTIGPKK